MNQTHVADLTHIYLDQEDILHIDSAEKASREDLMNFEQQLNRTLDEYYSRHSSTDRPVVIADLRKTNLASMLPFRRRYAQLGKLHGGPRKTGVLGSNRMAWILLSFIMNAAGMFRTDQNVKFFSSASNDEVKKWLKAT